MSPSIPELQPSGDGIARSSTVFYPVFVTNLTSLKIRKIAGRRQGNTPTRAPLTIRKYNTFFIIVKQRRKSFLAPGLWKSVGREDIRSAKSLSAGISGVGCS